MSLTEDAARRATLHAIRHRITRGAGDVGRPPADGPPLRIRLVGTPEDCADAVDALRQVLTIRHVSAPFPTRESRDQIRIYLHADAPGDAEGDARCASR